MHRTAFLLTLLGMLVFLMGCKPFYWRTLEARNTTVLRVVTDRLGNQVLLANGEIDGLHGPERGVLKSSSENGTSVFGAWELRPHAYPGPGGGNASLDAPQAQWKFDAARDSQSGQLLIVMMDVGRDGVTVYREFDYQNGVGVRFQAFERVASLRIVGSSAGSIVMRSDNAGVTELFHGTSRGVYYTSTNIKESGVFPSFGMLALNPAGFVFTSTPIAVGGDSVHREVLAIGKDATGRLAILKSRPLVGGIWSPWLAYHQLDPQADIGTPVGLTNGDGEAIFAVPYRGATILMSGNSITTVEGPSKHLSAALDSKGRIILASCDTFGVYSNQEVNPKTNTFLGWRTLKSYGYQGCGLDDFIHLNRNRAGRLLLVEGSHFSGIRYLWQAAPAGDWERVD